jgi:glycine cleavage system protein P-like pyridoxal-binding family
MNVQELIDQLSKYDPFTEVCIVDMSENNGEYLKVSPIDEIDEAKDLLENKIIVLYPTTLTGTDDLSIN